MRSRHGSSQHASENHLHGVPAAWLANAVLALGLVIGAAGAAADVQLIGDPKEMADSSGDIRSVGATVRGDFLFLSMTVDGVAAPSVEQTPEGMANRYYYHWLLDTDNNPATGRSNAEYEGNPTGLTRPVGSERVVMVGWRDGKPNGVEVYDPLNEDQAILSGIPFLASGNSVTAVVPLSALGLTRGQTFALSAFQEGASDGWAVDWVESATLTVDGPPGSVASVTDPADLGDSSGDIRSLQAFSLGDQVVFWMTVHGISAPSVANTPEEKVNRYYYHWLLDTDNNPATGRSNAEYEGTPTGLTRPVGSERVIMVGWRDGKPNGVELYDPLDEDTAILSNFPFQASGNSLMAMVPMSALGVARGQVVAVAAFQEGASDDWTVDWAESAVLTLDGPDQPVAAVADPADLGDSSGDVRRISAHVVGDELHLSLTVEGIAVPSVENTPEEKVNRYYYHWLLDTDNNPATGRSNSEYEGNPTGLTKPIGAERVVMIGWRDGKPNGVELYDPLNEDTAILSNFAFHASGNTLTAVIPLEPAGLTHGQSIAVSAFQEGASDDWSVDWIESAPLTVDAGEASEAPVAVVDDPVDMADANGDIRRIEATVEDGKLVLRMTVYGAVLPTVDETPEGMVNRHYYHWLLDTDNNPATGRSNSEYEGNPTGLSRPVGSERVIMVGWRNGDFDGREVYDPLNEDVAIVEDFEVVRDGATMEVQIPLADLGLALGQTIAVSAFQEGASDNWAVDWIESAELVLSEGALPGIDLPTSFDGNAYGFTARIEDQGAKQADPASVTATLDGNPAVVQASKTAGVTTVTGVHASVLAPNTTHTVKLSVAVSGEVQSRDFVFPVGPYTVLPTAGRLATVDQSNPGFLVYVTQISSDQIVTGERDAFQGRADLAEKQLRGELAPEGLPPYFNEADPVAAGLWKGPGVVVPGVVNWFELPGESASLNFPNDEPIPSLVGNTSDGVVVEILTYLELTPGSHKLGIYTEGGHQVGTGLSPGGALISLFDNSGETARIPTYFARNQFFDVIAPEAGYYPLRFLWLQNRRDQERGAILELFSVHDRTLHLLNASSDPLAIKAYRAGVLLTPGVEPLQLSVSPDSTAGSLKVTWTGGTAPFTVKRRASLTGGTWSDVATTSDRVAEIPLTGDAVFIEVVGQ